jgi:hypothetical protein
MVAWVVSLINIGVGLGLLPGGITSGFWPILWHWLKRIVHANGKARPFDDG